MDAGPPLFYLVAFLVTVVGLGGAVIWTLVRLQAGPAAEVRERERGGRGIGRATHDPCSLSPPFFSPSHATSRPGPRPPSNSPPRAAAAQPPTAWVMACVAGRRRPRSRRTRRRKTKEEEEGTPRLPSTPLPSPPPPTPRRP